MEQKVVRCPICGAEETIPVKVRRKHCVWCGYIMEEVKEMVEKEVSDVEV